MFRKQFRQTCRKCKGTGVTNKVLKNKDNQVIFAPEYHDPKDRGRPQYEPCLECDFPGSGLASYDTPTEVFVDGEKRKLEPQEREARFNDAPLA